MLGQPIADTRKIKQLVRRFPWLPWTFARIHIYPMLVRGKRVPMEARAFFGGVHGTADRLTDAATIGPDYDQSHARLHYNAVEGSILYALVDRGGSTVRSALDIGSGSGHWVDFLQRCFEPHLVMATDLSARSVGFLREKYAEDQRVRVEECDVVQGVPEGTFDVVTAIGVLFHIVDDAALVQALCNLRRVLSPDGVLLVGGYFGLTTRDIMFTRSGDQLAVTKRIRSRSWWRRNSRRAGLRVVQFIKTHNRRGFLFPENNLLVLTPE